MNVSLNKESKQNKRYGVAIQFATSLTVKIKRGIDVLFMSSVCFSDRHEALQGALCDFMGWYH